jgi:SAM-dependent methyltransferase
VTSHGHGQTEASIAKNADFFDHNDNYEAAQSNLEIYQLIKLAVTRELKDVESLLDVGNGGFFNYPTDEIREVVACDLMLKDEKISDNITHKYGSILELPFPDGTFECVLEQNVLHHVCGKSVPASKENLRRALSECIRVLKPGGKLVLVESTVPRWFYQFVEYPVFTVGSKIWPFHHPITLQYPRDMIVKEIEKMAGRIEEQAFIPRGNFVLQYGFKIPTFLTPIQALKLVARKQEIRA